MRRSTMVLALMLVMPLSVDAASLDPVTSAEVVAAITGRFPGNPPLYHEMRLKRAITRPASPTDVAQAAIADDRLGRGDEAVALMEARIKKIEGQVAFTHWDFESLSACRANLATFLANRWARQGSDRTRIGELERARDEIARAVKAPRRRSIEREKCQLRVLEWMISPPRMDAQGKLPNLMGFDDSAPPDPKAAHDAVLGLTDLVKLGGIWENVDVLNALGAALRHASADAQDPRSGFALLANLSWLRCHELIDAGRGSMVSDAPKGEKLKALIPLIGPTKLLGAFKDLFPRLRMEADAWQAARAETMIRWLKEGHEPDEFSFELKHPNRPPPGLPTIVAQEEELAPSPGHSGPVMPTPALIGLVIAIMLAVLTVAGQASIRRSRARPA